MEQVHQVAHERRGFAKCISCNGVFVEKDGRFGFELAAGVDVYKVGGNNRMSFGG